MPVIRSSVVFIQQDKYCYSVRGASSFDAAWIAIQEHELREKVTLADDSIVRVVVEGCRIGELAYDSLNRMKPNYLHPVGRVRYWASAMTKVASG